MFTYASRNDFLRVKLIDSTKLVDNPLGRENIDFYLRAATREIDYRTRRTFAPLFAVKLFQIPRDYIDLRARTMYARDLELDDDLLEAYRVQTGGYSLAASNQTVPIGGITSRASSFTVTDGTAFPAGTFLRIDNETMIVDEVSSNTLYVLRGQVKTKAVAHTAGTTIYTLNITTLNHGVDYQLLDFNATPSYGLRVVFPNTWAATYGAVSVMTQVPSIYITGLWGYHEEYEMAWVNTLDTVTDVSGLNAVITTINVADADGLDAEGFTRFSVGNLIRIDDEIMTIIDIAESSTVHRLTVLRGQRGTRATTHVTGSVIERFLTDSKLAQVTVSIAKTLRDADTSIGGRQGVSDNSVGVAITLPADAAEFIRFHARKL